MTEWNPDNPADLGIWDDLGWTQPPPAKKAKSLKLKKKAAGALCRAKWLKNHV